MLQFIFAEDFCIFVDSKKARIRRYSSKTQWWDQHWFRATVEPPDHHINLLSTAYVALGEVRIKVIQQQLHSCLFSVFLFVVWQLPRLHGQAGSRKPTRCFATEAHTPLLQLLLGLPRNRGSALDKVTLTQNLPFNITEYSFLTQRTLQAACDIISKQNTHPMKHRP